MGNAIVSLFSSESKARKRKHDEISQPIQALPKRFRSTLDYLYQKLFLEGEGSDITIIAFDKIWNLHKIYICQSPFFSSMFCGSWVEHNKNTIDLCFTDDKINIQSLNIVFGSFYNDVVSITESNVTSVLATSIWFQLNDLIAMCIDLIVANLRLDNIVEYSDLSVSYNLTKLNKTCIDWISKTILLVDDCDLLYNILQSISPSLMIEIIGNSKLYVVQVEEDVLLLLLKWMYLKIAPNPKIYGNEFVQLVRNYFDSNEIQLTEFEEPELMIKLFKQIRWFSIIGTFSTAVSVLKLKVFPCDLIYETFKNQWLTMLECQEDNNNNSVDIIGPPKNLNPDLFWKFSERCGRILTSDNNATWRWSGYKYGIDVVIRYVQRLREFYIIRFSTQSDYTDWLSNLTPWSSSASSTSLFGSSSSSSSSTRVRSRRVQVQISIASCRFSDSYKNKDNSKACYPIYSDEIETEILNVDLALNNPIKIATLPVNIFFPVVLSVNLLRYDPTRSVDNTL